MDGLSFAPRKTVQCGETAFTTRAVPHRNVTLLWYFGVSTVTCSFSFILLLRGFIWSTQHGTVIHTSYDDCLLADSQHN
jgi:hypothetical protein